MSYTVCDGINDLFGDMKPLLERAVGLYQEAVDEGQMTYNGRREGIDQIIAAFPKLSDADIALVSGVVVELMDMKDDKAA